MYLITLKHSQVKSFSIFVGRYFMTKRIIDTDSVFWANVTIDVGFGIVLDDDDDDLWARNDS